jgi:hypothetical protein
MADNNLYIPFLIPFFQLITDFKHNSDRLNKVLLEDIKIYTADGAEYYSGTALIIADWTGPTEDGWELPFHTGVIKETETKNYEEEIKTLLSREFGLVFAQCYEGFETLLKDFVDIKYKSDENFRNKINSKKTYSRNSLNGGNELFDYIKKAGGSSFYEFSNRNNKNFKFKELFTVFSELRHAITHSQGKLKKIKIPETRYYKDLFVHLLPLNDLDNEIIVLKLDYQIIERMLKYLAEFAYQIFKILSKEDGYNVDMYIPFIRK